MYKGNAIQRKEFSICLQQQHDPSLSGEPAGVIVMGGTNERLNQEEMTYAQLVTEGPWFTIYVQAIYLELVTKDDNGKEVTSRIEKLQGIDAMEFNQGEIIIDSGSTDNHLPNTMREPFENAWYEIMKRKYDASEVYSVDGNYPNIVFQLKAADVSDKDVKRTPAVAFDPDRPKDVIIRVPPENFMLEEEGGGMGLHMNDDPKEGGMLGAQTMKGKNILFDNANSRIGFATSKCEL
jgi:hypothetical protein